MRLIWVNKQKESYYSKLIRSALLYMDTAGRLGATLNNIAVPLLSACSLGVSHITSVGPTVRGDLIKHIHFVLWCSSLYTKYFKYQYLEWFPFSAQPPAGPTGSFHSILWLTEHNREGEELSKYTSRELLSTHQQTPQSTGKYFYVVPKFCPLC